MDRGAWQVTVHRVAKNWTELKRAKYACTTAYTLPSWADNLHADMNSVGKSNITAIWSPTGENIPRGASTLWVRLQIAV